MLGWRILARAPRMTYMATPLTLERVRSDIEVLARAGLDLSTFLEEFDASLQRAVPHVAACVANLDPATRLLTSTYKFGDLYGKDSHDMEWGLQEYSGDSPDAFSTLLDGGLPACGVHLETSGDVSSSQRFRRVMQPHYGYGDELRLVARQGTQGWGGVALFRGVDDRPFNREEVNYVARLSEPLAAGLRAGLLAGHVGGSDRVCDTGPAVLIIGADDRIARMSMGTDSLLAELGRGENMADTSGTIYSLVAEARRNARVGADHSARCRVRMASGRWLVMNASPLADLSGPSGEVVITIEEARPPEIVSLVVAAFQLTARERDVTQLVLQGVDTKEIASSLNMSRYTVQDHLKSVFEKADVRSRRELVARVFFDQYMPRMGSELAPSGWFASESDSTVQPG